MGKTQRLIGSCTYADGTLFNGTLRIQKTDGNVLENVWREIPIVNGIIPDYIKLSPGIYNVQWMATSPVGFLPAEEWVVPEIDQISLKDLRSTGNLQNILEKKDSIIIALKGEVERVREELKALKATVASTPTLTTDESVIEAGIQAVIFKEGLG